MCPDKKNGISSSLSTCMYNVSYLLSQELFFDLWSLGPPKIAAVKKGNARPVHVCITVVVQGESGRWP